MKNITEMKEIGTERGKEDGKILNGVFRSTANLKLKGKMSN
jgi:hypothetical protein